METKNCQNCKKDFNIDQDDVDFYEKIKVPHPTWCSSCRFMRRLSFLNWFTLYRRKCDSCGESMISTIHADNPLRVFCAKCWWADKWDGTEYAMDYDPNRNFLEQLLELRNKSTFMSNESLYSTLVNSPYVNATAYQKDCFMVFNADYGERNAYCMIYAHLSDSLDGYRLKESELCYECTGMYKSYHCIYSEELDSCTDVHFSRSCFGCTDCVGCINLRNKTNCIFNQQYSKEEYKEKVTEMKLNTRDGMKNMLQKSKDFWLTQPRRAVVGNSLNVNTSGDFVYESKNTHDSYMISGAEDSRYLQMLTMPTTKGSYDYTNWGNNAENLYECLTVGEGAYNDRFCVQCWPNAIDNEYCLYAIQPKDCFGCCNLKRQQYCILNKQYTKEEYLKLKAQIIEDMKVNPYIDSAGRIYGYGELFPFEFSPFAYNETMANYYFQVSKEDAVAGGLKWYDIPDPDHKTTMKASAVPQSVEDIDYKIQNEIIQCSVCSNGYRINPQELYLHKKIGVPLPDSCWKCRFKRRFDTVNGPYLYNRSCAKCNKSIETSYAADRPEIVYCESCYQQEVI